MGSQANTKLTLWTALKDLGWLPLFMMGVGGLSIVDILEKAIFGELSLIMPFQYVLDGYQIILDRIGAAVEPIVQPMFAWLNDRFGWDLDLQPHWRSLFVLFMTYVMAMLRAQWRKQDFAGMATAVLGFVLFGFGGVVVSLCVGLLPLTGVWWMQGLVAAAPAAILFALSFSLLFVLALTRGDPKAALQAFLGQGQGLLVFSLFMFALGAGLSFLPGVSNGAGILALGAFIALSGAVYTFSGLRTDIHQARAGLSMLGGFIAAGLILLSNWAIIMLS